MKANRQDKIIEIIQQNDIETQEELAHLLAAAGFHVTQATISRDIRALHLEKIPDGKGGSKYSYPQSGMAMAVAAALDHMMIPEIVGCIAGDDTIMCASKSDDDAKKAIEQITKLLTEL